MNINRLIMEMDEMIAEAIGAPMEELPQPVRVYINGKVTVVEWEHGRSTRATCSDGDTYDPYVGFAICFLKKISKKEDVLKWIENNTVKHETKKKICNLCGCAHEDVV